MYCVCVLSMVFIVFWCVCAGRWCIVLIVTVIRLCRKKSRNASATAHQSSKKKKKDTVKKKLPPPKMGNQQMREDDGEYYYTNGMGYHGREMEDPEKYVKMLDNSAKDDSKSYLQQYPDAALDDPKKDLNWAFYDNQVTNMGDEIAAKVEEMHQWYGDYEKLERQHDYIQFLFPLMDPSLFNPKIQLLQRHEVRKIRRDKAASLRVRKSFEMMLDFFGFQLADVSKGNSFPKITPHTRNDTQQISKHRYD